MHRRKGAARIAAVMVASFGLYAIVWHFETWRDLHKERRGHYPLAHAAGFVIPFYSLYVTYRHATSINASMIAAGVRSTLHPRIAVALVAAVGASLTLQFSLLGSGALGDDIAELGTALSLDMLDTALLSTLVIWSQRNLDRLRHPSAPLGRHALPSVGEIIAVSGGGYFWYRSITCLIDMLG